MRKSMENNDIIKLLDRHKKNIICDLCTKKIRFYQKGVRCVIRTKDNIWAEYFHIKCLEKRGVLRRIREVKAGRWDNNDKDREPSSNVVH